MADLQMLAAQKGSTSIGKARILVVDDNQDAAHTLARLLNLIGYSASSVFDGEAAIIAIENFSPTLVFLDLCMPVMDGVETARRIREMPNGREIILVALTGHEREEDIARTRAAGFVTHLVKPVNLALLEQSLCELVGLPAEGRRPFPK